MAELQRQQMELEIQVRSDDILKAFGLADARRRPRTSLLSSANSSTKARPARIAPGFAGMIYCVFFTVRRLGRIASVQTPRRLAKSPSRLSNGAVYGLES